MQIVGEKMKQNMDAVSRDLPHQFVQAKQSFCLIINIIIYSKSTQKYRGNKFIPKIKLKINIKIVEFCECKNKSKGNAYEILSIQLNT